MDNLTLDMEKLRSFGGAPWNENRSARVLANVHRKIQRARSTQIAVRSAVVGGLLVGLLGAAAFGLSNSPQSSSATARSSQPSEIRDANAMSSLTLPDGTAIRSLSRDAAFELTRMDPQTSALKLRSGAARFDVAPRPERLFRVTVGRLHIEVLGTSFDVRREGARTEVSVRDGKVRARWSDRSFVLSRGQRMWFPPPEPRSPTVRSSARRTYEATVVRPSTRRFRERKLSNETKRELLKQITNREKESWRNLARRGLYKKALAALPERPDDNDLTVEDLMSAADVARKAGHPQRALPWLRHAAQRIDAPQSILAAFTLGRLLLEHLSRPREAAAQFAYTFALNPDGNLAEDALIREIESWVRAGATEKARERARYYARRFANSPRSREVRRILRSSQTQPAP